MTPLLRFAHFVLDDKFTLDSINCFERAGYSNNSWFCYKKRKDSCLHYITSEKVSIIDFQQALLFVSAADNCDVIVLHSLYSLPSYIINRIHKNKKVIWYAWGFDLYSNPLPIKPLLELEEKYMPLTRHLLLKQNIFKKYLQTFKHWYRLVFDSTYSRKEVFSAIGRIDFFAGVFQEEYDLMKKECEYFRADKMIHDYIHPEEFQSEEIDSSVLKHGSNIMLGNSATPLCNHLDILHILGNVINNPNTLIYCPLSYQGTKEYVDLIIKEGKALFGERFIPLNEFLPLRDYLNIVNSCGSIILGQMQQAATCNILSSIWAGVKVFVPKNSMNYHHYLDEGESVFAIEDLNQAVLDYQLETDKILKDRHIIESIYSYRKWQENLLGSIELLTQINS